MPIDDATPKAERPSSPLYIDLFAAQAMFAAVLGTILAIISIFPRNADNSMPAAYTIPAFLILSIISGVLLWKRMLPHRALRIVCWFFIVFAVLAIPATLADVAWRNSA